MPEMVEIEYNERLIVRGGQVQLSRRPVGWDTIAAYLLCEDGSLNRRLEDILVSESFDTFEYRIDFTRECVPDGSTVLILYRTRAYGQVLTVNAEHPTAGNIVVTADAFTGCNLSIGDACDWCENDGTYSCAECQSEAEPTYDEFAEVLS